MRITAKNFFENYIVNPMSLDLTADEKLFALFFSIILLPLTLGIAHGVAAIIVHRRVCRSKASFVPENHSNFEKVKKRTKKAAQKVLFLPGIKPKFDHSAPRTTFFAYVFAYLYQKYHPAKNDQKALDKAVDSAKQIESANAVGDRPVQPRDDFERTRSSLSIYQELDARSKGQNGERIPLKNGFTFDDFVFELDSVRKEMNMLIYSTNKKRFRDKLPEGKNHFDAYIRKMNRAQYPLLNSILMELGVIAPIRKKKPEPEKDLAAKECEARQRKQQLEDFRAHPSDAAYAALRPLDRDTVRSTFLKQYQNEEQPSPSHPFVKLELQHEALKNKLNYDPQDPTLKKLFSKALRKQCHKMIKSFNEISPDLKDYRMLTTVSLAFEKICEMHLELGSKKKAKRALEEASHIPFDPSIDMEKLLQGKKHRPLFLTRGASSTRKRRIRICKKTVDGKNVAELSFELTRQAREKLDKKIALLKKDPRVAISTVLDVGVDKKITMDGITIFVGADFSLWNQYHLVRVVADEGISLQKCHEALAKIGLPTALMLSRPEDERKEALGRAIAFRYPFAIYKKNKEQIDPETAYQSLKPTERQQIDLDLVQMHVKNVGKDLQDLVNPSLVEEARKVGAQAFFTFVRGGDIKGTSKVMADILTSGAFLSTQERNQWGIFGLSYCEKWNYKQGSANQVFAHLLPKEWFDKKMKLDKFSLKGRVMVLLDLKAIERMPYTYPKEQGGVRNPYFDLPIFGVLSAKQRPEILFKGAEKMANRQAFPKNIQSIIQKKAVQNEVMFDHSLSTQYIRKLVVQSEVDKYILIKELEDKKVFDINGIPLEKAVMVSKKLDSSMIG